MKVAVMQPYLFPYVGYFQLINAVDQFVVLDDVNYIKRGWINRNRILLGQKVHFITVSVADGSQNRKINAIEILLDDKEIKKKLNTIYHAYNKAPYFDQVFSLLTGIFFYTDKNLCRFITHSLKTMINYFDIRTDFFLSSEFNISNQFKGQEKIIEICKKSECTHYINPIGGVGIYGNEIFENCGIQLSFLKSDKIAYQQFGGRFIPDLSIIDLLMFNSKTECKEMLHQYRLLNGLTGYQENCSGEHDGTNS